jgi:hypothetical protein
VPSPDVKKSGLPTAQGKIKALSKISQVSVRSSLSCSNQKAKLDLATDQELRVPALSGVLQQGQHLLETG